MPAPRSWRRVCAGGSPIRWSQIGKMGWVTLETDLYCRPVKRIAVRCRKKNGQWGYGVILSILAPKDVLRLTGGYEQEVDDPKAVLLAYVHFYDQRGVAWKSRLRKISEAWPPVNAIRNASNPSRA